MRFARYCVIAAVIILLATNTGCIRKWSYDFTKASADLNDWYHNFLTYTLDENGLTYAQGIINPPHWFSGDVSVTLIFELDVSEISPATTIQFGLSDELAWGQNDVWAGIYYLGDPALENWELGDYGGGSGEFREKHDEQLPGIYYSGPNTMKFSKDADVISLSVNGVVVGQLDLVHSKADELFPTFSFFGATGQLIIQNVLVEYNGRISELWPVA